MKRKLHSVIFNLSTSAILPRPQYSLRSSWLLVHHPRCSHPSSPLLHTLTNHYRLHHFHHCTFTTMTETRDSTLPPFLNPAKLLTSPLRAIWSIQGNNVPALWWPSRIESSSITTHKVVLLMLPGNPGLIDYYIPFLQTLHETSQVPLEIYGTSHLGHSSGDHEKVPSRLYTLKEQVENKIAIFDALKKQYSGPGQENTKFVLVGHSMGAWLSLQVLKQRPDQGIANVFGLFPTVHHILDTPNGQRLKNAFKPTSRAIVGGAVSTLKFIFSAPKVLQGLVGLITGQDRDMAKITSQSLLHASVVKNCLFLAGQEMETITDLDTALIDKHADKFVFYYGETDEWAPIEHYREMKKQFPQVKSILCEQGMKHAFVIGHGEAMGELVAGWVNEL